MAEFKIPVFSLAVAIRNGLNAYEAGTGRLILDQDSLVARPKYQSLDEAIEALDLMSWKLRDKGLLQETDPEIRENPARLLMEPDFVYDFPPGWDKGSAAAFPFNYESFEREYHSGVFFEMYGDKTVQDLFLESIGAMLLLREDIESRFGSSIGVVKEHNNDPDMIVPKAKKWRREEISQEDAAKLCGVSRRLIQSWEAGHRTPPGYPRRYDTIVFKAWAITYQQSKQIKAMAENMNDTRPIDRSQFDNNAYKNALEDP